MRDLEFSGYWEGEAVYSCDCCGKDDGEVLAWLKEPTEVL